jgi:hypothetical protein
MTNLLMKQEKPPLPERQLARQPELAALLRRCLASDGARRPTAAELQREVLALLGTRGGMVDAV